MFCLLLKQLLFFFFFFCNHITDHFDALFIFFRFGQDFSRFTIFEFAYQNQFEDPMGGNFFLTGYKDPTFLGVKMFIFYLCIIFILRYFFYRE
jgi:hypothetical protein